MIDKKQTNLFFCYSHKLAYFIKSQGINYINKGVNRNNHLSYFVFNKSNKLDDVIKMWNELKFKGGQN